MAKKINKTNAMRILDSLHIAYDEIAYAIDDGHIDGHSVYKKVGMEPDGFFKTLVTRGKDNAICVFVIPVLKELDLKKAAKAAGEKNVAMIAVKELLGITGYIRGGCSPIGMKKKFATFFDQSIENLDKIFVSGGKQGLLIGTSPTDILHATEGSLADLTV
jgi:Cys-tRNA(Pro)/Cys-tRNA(Cys) deacylase